MFIDFLISTHFGILNGRMLLKNDFTYVSSNGGASVIDYCLVSYEDLVSFANRVHRIRPLMQDVIGCENINHIPMPNHSILSWTYLLTNTETISVTNENEPGEDPRKFTIYNRKNIPPTFLAHPETFSEINYKIEDLQASQNIQSNINEVYSDFCDKMKPKNHSIKLIDAK